MPAACWDNERWSGGGSQGGDDDGQSWNCRLLLGLLALTRDCDIAPLCRKGRLVSVPVFIFYKQIAESITRV